MIDLIHAGPAFAAAFIGSAVEAVEALTIVLAVGTVRGWRPALLGAATGIVVLAVIVFLFGPGLALIPIHILQLVVGILLLLFGIRWLRKAILRAAGVIALHDEAAAYAKATRAMNAGVPDSRARQDVVAMITTFKAVMLEGIEVVVIVIGVGAVGNMLVPAGAGAFAACLLIAGLGLALHRPLSRVPENALKFAVGILISAFGLFWFGEGIGAAWPYGDAAIIGIAAAFLLASIVAVSVARRVSRRGRATVHRQRTPLV